MHRSKKGVLALSATLPNEGLIMQCSDLAQLTAALSRRKVIWRLIGSWMDNASQNDGLPAFFGFEYSSSEEKLIQAILEATIAKRQELMQLELRSIEPDQADYRWSDLIAYPDVQRSIKEKVGFKEETWIEAVLPMLLRMRPSSMVIRLMQVVETVKKSADKGMVSIALQTLENAYVAEKEAKSNAGKYAVTARHAHSEESKALEEIEQVWKEWRLEQDSGLDYKNNDDFSEQMANLFQAVKASTVKAHCPKWAKKYNFTTPRGRPKKG